jgi:hypothetical protein
VEVDDDEVAFIFGSDGVRTIEATISERVKERGRWL